MKSSSVVYFLSTVLLAAAQSPKGCERSWNSIECLSSDLNCKYCSCNNSVSQCVNIGDDYKCDVSGNTTTTCESALNHGNVSVHYNVSGFLGHLIPTTKLTTKTMVMTTAQSPSPTTTPPPTTTTTAALPPKSSPSNYQPNYEQPTRPPSTISRRFDGPSFVGGIVLACGLLAIAYIGIKFYRARTEHNYHTLHEMLNKESSYSTLPGH